MFARVIKKALRNWLKALAANDKLNAAVLVSRSAAFAAGRPMCRAASGPGAQREAGALKEERAASWDPSYLEMGMKRRIFRNSNPAKCSLERLGSCFFQQEM